MITTRKNFLGHSPNRAVLSAVAAALLAAGSASALSQQQRAAAQDNPAGPVIGKTYAESREGVKAPQVKPRAGAPNIIWILLDDVGFGASSAFGGPIPTPTFDKLANGGLRYTN